MQASKRALHPACDAETRADAGSIREEISGLLVNAMACLSPTRVSAAVRDLLGGLDPVSLPPDRQAEVMADSLMMATTLALFTPSSSGTMAVDRLVKQRGASSPAQTAAVAALRRARFRLLRVEDARDGSAFLSDVVSNERLRVDEEAVPPGMAGLALTAGFVRPGRPELVNPLRCAEAVFRHGLQNGIVAVPGLNAPPLGEEDGFDDEPSDLDALAFVWAEPGAVQDPDDVQFVREQADLETVVAMLASAANTREHGLTFLSGGYAAIAQIQLETVQRRATAGSGSLRLAAIEAAVGAGIGTGDLPAGTRIILTEVRQRLGAVGGTGPRARKADAELDRLVGRIQALRAKTVKQGCTEQEALAAAEKVAELLDRGVR